MTALIYQPTFAWLINRRCTAGRREKKKKKKSNKIFKNDQNHGRDWKN